MPACFSLRTFRRADPAVGVLAADDNARLRAACPTQTDPIVETDIPARLDRLPWGRFHTLVVVALGITWILDGLEVTLAGTVAGALKASPVLQFSNADVGLAGSAYLAGAVLGAMFFGWLTDRLGPQEAVLHHARRLPAWRPPRPRSRGISGASSLFRFITGAGIGGEYAAINSTIQELVPARVRGWTDLVINGWFWIGAALGAVGAIVLLDPAVIDPEHGWRAAFLIGALLALRRVLHAAVAAGKPALADDAWPRRGGRGDRRRHRGAAARRGARRSPMRRCRRCGCAAAATRRSREVRHTLLHVHRQRTLRRRSR